MLGNSHIFYLSLLLALFTPATFADSIPPTSPISSFELNNGLKLVVLEDHRVPLAITQMWYQVGSADEGMGETGISHMLEHMAFKGTLGFPGDRASKIVARLGGIENAFTSRDYTVFHLQLAAEHIDTALQIEAERLHTLQFDTDQFTAERQVVLQERQRNVEDNPNALLFEHFYLNAYSTSPYRQPIIGWPADINSWNINDLREWYDQWYTPANAILIVAGDVDPAAIVTRVKQLFGTIPTAPTPKRHRLPEVAMNASRQVDITLPAQLSLMVMGFRAPSLITVDPKQTEDIYALHVLSAVLSSGQGSRLYNELVRTKKIASHVSTSYNPLLREDSLFAWLGQPADGVTLEQLEQEFMAQIKILQTQPMDLAELERIKIRVKADSIYERDQLFGRATELGQTLSLGLDTSYITDFAANINAVTPAMIQSVAQRYLTTDRRTVARRTPLAVHPSEPTL